MSLHHASVSSVSTLGRVIEIVRGLRPPAPGKIRVFRGQTKHFTCLSPSALRHGPQNKDAGWRACASLIAEAMFRERADRAHLPESFNIWNESAETKGIPIALHQTVRKVWFDAVAQHYGGTSHYLDVTESLESALWFALHSFEQTEPITSRDRLADVPAFDYRPVDGGYLYVMDVTPWSGEAIHHGELVTLKQGPKEFSSSRMLAQEGSLLFADASVSSDLSSLCVCEPIRVSRPMTGLASLARTADEMFPGPDADDWYAKLLSVPCVPRRGEPSAPVVRSRQAYENAVGTVVYAPSGRNPSATTSRIAVLQPPNLLRRITELPAMQQLEQMLRFDPERSLDRATPIVLETAVMYPTPPVDSSMWNESLLFEDRATYSVVMDSTGKGFDAPLFNQFLQFSPLESLGWQGTPDKPAIVYRALWLVECEGDIFATVFAQLWPYQPEGDGLMIMGPYHVVHHAERRQAFACHVVERKWRTLAELGQLAKAIYSGLELWRNLSPGWKCSALAALVSRSGSAAAFHVQVSEITCALELTHSEALSGDLVVRLLGSKEPYAGPFEGIERSNARWGLTSLPAGRERHFSDFGAAVLARHAKAFGQAQDESLPAKARQGMKAWRDHVFRKAPE
jgi:hypothetical protein